MKPNIVQAAQAFKEWRANRTKRSHTPTHLRERAVALVGHYPTQQICDLLKINSRSIKSWCKQQAPSQEFVTLTEQATPAVAMALNGLQLKILAPGGIECHLSGELTAPFVASLLHAMQEEASQ